MAARPRPNSVEYGNSKTTTLLPSAKCMRPLFWLRRASIRLAWYRHMPAFSLNKVSKSEETRKVEYAYIFFTVCRRCLPKIIKNIPCLTKLQLAKVGSFLGTVQLQWTTMRSMEWCHFQDKRTRSWRSTFRSHFVRIVLPKDFKILIQQRTA